MIHGQMEPMTPEKPVLSDTERAALAWARYRRLMLWMVGAATGAVIAAIFYLKAQGGPFPVQMMIATIAGVGFSVLLAAGLMGLVFLSAKTGHDEDASDHSRGDR